VPSATAVLRRVRCRATSKRTGERCGQWCAPGHLVCYAHGGRSPQAIRSARVRAAVAEVLAADPRRSPREVLADALHIADLVMTDEVSKLRDAEVITPELAAALTDAATRAAALARAALDAGVDVDGEVPLEYGDLVVRVLNRVGSALLSAWAAPAGDWIELEAWLRSAVPAALRGQEIPDCPRPWTPPRPVWPHRQIESVATVRARQAAEVERALDGVRGSESGWADPVVPKAEPGRSSPQRNGTSPSRAGSVITVHERERAWLRSIGKLGSLRLPPVGR
jgi:hypothetical protein